MCISKRMYLFAGLKLISPVLYFSKINKSYQNTKRKKKYWLKTEKFAKKFTAKSLFVFVTARCYR